MNHPLARTWTEHVTAPICGILSAWYCLLCLCTVRLGREKRGAASPRGSTGPRGAQGKLQQQLGPIPPQKAPASLCTGGSKKIRQESGPLAAGSGKTQPRKSQLGLCPTTKGANRKSSSLLREYSVLSAPRKQASTPQKKAYFCWVNLQIARRIFIFSSSLLSQTLSVPTRSLLGVAHGGADALLFRELPSPALFSSPFYRMLSP